jgi:hypothetical protein
MRKKELILAYIRATINNDKEKQFAILIDMLGVYTTDELVFVKEIIVQLSFFDNPVDFMYRLLTTYIDIKNIINQIAEEDEESGGAIRMELKDIDFTIEGRNFL